MCCLHAVMKCGNTLLRSVICGVMTCTEDIQCIAGLTADELTIKCTHQRYCNMPLNLCACNGPADIAAPEYAVRCPSRLLPDAYISTTGAVSPSLVMQIIPTDSTDTNQ